MKVKIIKDSTDIFLNLFEGSVIQNVEEKGKNYCGVFSSFMGSYYVEVPKKRCKKIKDEIKKSKNIFGGWSRSES
jgi:hypothetical protein